jgi:transposase
MRDKDLYARILGIEAPWRVADVELKLKDEEVRVVLEQAPGTKQVCPRCGATVAGYDKHRRRWRHLDTCQFRTLVQADVPRVRCPEHGVLRVPVPWAEPNSGFTALFESLVIDWLGEASVSAVSRRLGLSWGAVDRIMQRAVGRGLARRERQYPRALTLDETAFRKRHDYVSIVSDGEHVLHVAEDRKKESLDAYYASLTDEQKAAVECVSMDMWQAFISATLEAIPNADEKIAFDKFHVAKYLGDAVDKVRRAEHRALKREGDTRLTGTKYTWLENPHNMSAKHRGTLNALRESALKTARAWAIKEFGMDLWHYVSRTWARKGWQRWYDWAIRSRLEPIKKVARTIKAHLWGILNAVVLKANNASAESINSRIQMVKYRSRGFRNKARFANAIYFHLGGLDLYPEGVR